MKTSQYYNGGEYVVGFWIFAIIALICGTIVFICYMYFCYDNSVGLFEDISHRYEKRIKNLEQKVEQLMEVNK